MRALLIHGPDDTGQNPPPPVLPQLHDIPPPRGLLPGQVRIRMAAAALDRDDLALADGTHPETPARPFAPGRELSGIVAAVHPAAQGVFVGDRVMARVAQGAFAEEVLALDRHCAVMPRSMSYAHGAVFLDSHVGTHLALVRRGRLRRGEKLVVTGIGSAIGLAAVEIGAALGAVVCAADGSTEKLQRAKARGAKHLIDYHGENPAAAVAAAVGRADLIFDPLGGVMFERLLGAAGTESRVVVVRENDAPSPPILMDCGAARNIDLILVNRRDYGDAHPGALAESCRAMSVLYETGAFKPRIAHILPLEKGADAYRLLATGGVEGDGRILLRPGTGDDGDAGGGETS